MDGGELVGFEVNVVDLGEFGSFGVVGIREIGGEGGIKNRENEEVSKKLVDLKEEGGKLVSYEGDEEKECGKVDGELGGGDKVVDWGDKILGFEVFEGGERNFDKKVEIGVVLGSDKVGVDD